MSEFTSGNLILRKDKGSIEKYRSEGVKLKDLNAMWSVFLTEDTYIEGTIPTYIIDISKDIPILYFFNFEDKGWGYKIISNGEIISKITVYHDLEFDMVLEKALEKYPEEEDIIGFLYYTDKGKEVLNNITRDIKKSEIFCSAVKAQFTDRNTEGFKLFNLSVKEINLLNKFLNEENYITSTNHRELVGKYKEVINIKEMEWINYEIT